MEGVERSGIMKIECLRYLAGVLGFALVRDVLGIIDDEGLLGADIAPNAFSRSLWSTASILWRPAASPPVYGLPPSR